MTPSLLSLDHSRAVLVLYFLRFAAKQGKKSKKRSRDKFQGDKGFAGEGPCSDARSSFGLISS